MTQRDLFSVSMPTVCGCGRRLKPYIVGVDTGEGTPVLEEFEAAGCRCGRQYTLEAGRLSCEYDAALDDDSLNREQGK